MRTSQKSITEVCRILICSLEARAVNRSVSQGADVLLRTIEETCFSTISKSLKPRDPSILLLKTFPTCWGYRRESATELSLKKFQNWGIVCAGVCLTAPALEYRSQDEGCSLSDILEKDVPPKYYLSDEAMQKIYQEQTLSRDELKVLSENQMSKIVEQIQNSSFKIRILKK